MTPRDVPEDQRRVNDQEIAWYDELASKGAISKPFAWSLLFSADSRFPELAGLAGAISGSFYALLVYFLISFPVGIDRQIGDSRIPSTMSEYQMEGTPTMIRGRTRRCRPCALMMK